MSNSRLTRCKMFVSILNCFFSSKFTLTTPIEGGSSYFQPNFGAFFQKIVNNSLIWHILYIHVTWQMTAITWRWAGTIKLPVWPLEGVKVGYSFSLFDTFFIPCTVWPKKIKQLFFYIKKKFEFQKYLFSAWIPSG